ncbi:MAG: glycosyltransferase family 4 protein, partial [Bacteroidetes bacterium]|nr:glycosyltransferase family 4 protein [Bacteroidota bacterium]
HFTGRVTDAEFDAVLKRSDVFLFPFRKNGFGLKLLGAMAAGLPIITSQEEGVSDLVIENVTGITVPRNDEIAFAAAMNRMAPDEGYRQRLGKNGKDLATKLYNFELHAERMLYLYKQIVERASIEKFSVPETQKKTKPKR